MDTARISEEAVKKIKAEKDDPKIKRETALRRARDTERILEIEREQIEMEHKHRDQRYKG